MGNWLTTRFFRIDSLFFQFPSTSHQRRNRFLTASQGNNINSNPGFLVRVAAEILAFQKMEKDRAEETSDENYPEDTDFSSSEDDSCPEMNSAEEQRLHERNRVMAFSGRVSIGDEKSMTSLREDIKMRCVCAPSTSLVHICAARELGASRRQSSAMPNRVRTSLVNNFMPNRRKNVDSVRTKTFCCQYADKGKLLVVASQDEVIRFYQKNSRKSKYSSRYLECMQMKVDACSWSILDVAVSEKAEVLCYSTWKAAIFLAKMQKSDFSNSDDHNVMWNSIELGETEHNTAVFCIRFSQDGNQVVCGASDYGIHVFDVERKQKIRAIASAHEDDVNTVCFADENSNLIYSSGDDGLVKVWDRRAWSDGDDEPVGIFAGHRDGVTYVDSRGDDRYLLSNCKDQTIKLWDLRKFSGKEGIAATRACIQTQKWDYRWQPAPPGLCQPVEGDTSVMTLRGHNVLHTLIRAKFSPEMTGKRYIYTGCARGEVVVYDMMTGSVCNRLKGHSAVVRDIDWHPEENEIVSCSWDGTTSVWSYDERQKPYDSPNQYNDEDSCDEWYQPILKSRRTRRCPASTRQQQMTRINASSSEEEEE